MVPWPSAEAIATSPPDWRAKPKIWREAEAGALADRLGGEEGLEHPVEMLGRDAGAGVADADADIVAGGQVGDLGLGQGDVVDLDRRARRCRPSRRGR